MILKDYKFTLFKSLFCDNYHRFSMNNVLILFYSGFMKNNLNAI